MTKIQADHTLSSSSSSSTSSELLDWWNLSYNSYSRKLFTSSAQLQQLSSSTIYPESSSSSQLSQSLAILHNHLSHLELPPNNPNTLAVLQRAHSITLDLVDKAKRKTDALLQQLQPQLGPPPPSLPATITSMPRTHQPKMVIMPPPPPLDRASTSINTPLNNPTAFISPSLSSAITACSTSTSTAAITSAGPTTSSTAKRRKNPLSTSNPRALQASPTPPTPQLLHQPSMSPSFLNLSVYNPSDSSFIQEQKQGKLKRTNLVESSLISILYPRL